MTIEFLFNSANIFVLPFWALMVLLPNWHVTRRVMKSLLPFVVLAAAYLYCFISSVSPDTAQDFSSAGLADIARLFADERVAATGWIHFVVMDLFVGRWIYWDGQQSEIFTRHSLALCLFAGPLGLLSHILTRWGVQSFRQSKAASAAADSETGASEAGQAEAIADASR